LMGLASKAVEARPEKGAGERVNFLSPRRRLMLCFASELVFVRVLGEAVCGCQVFQ
jgi:hypothetical protein